MHFTTKHDWSKLITCTFFKNKVNNIPASFPAHFNATGCRLWYSGYGSSLQQSVANGTQKTIFQIDSVQISGPGYIIGCFHWHVPQKCVLHSWNHRESGYIADFAFEIRTQTARHIIAVTPAWTKSNFINRANPPKNNVDLFKHGRIINYVVTWQCRLCLLSSQTLICLW